MYFLRSPRSVHKWPNEEEKKFQLLQSERPLAHTREKGKEEHVENNSLYKHMTKNVYKMKIFMFILVHPIQMALCAMLLPVVFLFLLSVHFLLVILPSIYMLLQFYFLVFA